MKNMIIVHCSATPPSMEIGASDIRRWHVEDNKWADIGYNYVIPRNGCMQSGRDLNNDGDCDDDIGAHAYGFNRHSIGICMVGGIDDNGKPEANYTLEQYLCLANLITRIKRDNAITRVVGHTDIDPRKPCPCFNVKEFARGL